MKPNKVAFLLNEFPTVTETFILNQIVFLIESGIDVHIFSLYPGDFMKLHGQFQGYSLERKVTYVATIPNSPIQRFREAIKFFRQEDFWNSFHAAIQCINPLNFGLSGLKLTHFLYYTRLFQMYQYDLVHAHFGIMGAFFSKFSKIGVLKNTPFLVSFHGYDLAPSQKVRFAKLYRKMFINVKLLTVNSRYSSDLLTNIEICTRPSIRILPMGVNTGFFDRSTYSKLISKGNLHEFKLICVGRLISLKGADRAIDILEIIVKKYGFKHIDLVIIGEGPLHLNLEKAILEKDLKKNVRLLGGRSQIEIKEELASSELLIYPGKIDNETGRAEAQGLVVIEAQSMGLPVVAFDVGGVGEGIQNNKTGILVSPDDVDAFAKSVMELLLNPNKRKEMGENAQAFVKSNFDTQILGQKLLEIYEEVLE